VGLRADPIKECRERWFDNDRMARHCIDQVDETTDRIIAFLDKYGLADDYSTIPYEELLEKIQDGHLPAKIHFDCLTEWRRNYERLASCYEQQEREAIRTGKLQ